mgnify:CR=1 FL=1
MKTMETLMKTISLYLIICLLLQVFTVEPEEEDDW